MCWDGECLTWDGREEFYRPVEWLRYLLEHFLAPEAHAKSSGLEYFRGFTFDHRADGIVIANRRDTRELSAICVQDNVVTERILMPGDDDPRRRRPLAYEEELDRVQAEVAASRTLGPDLHAV